MSGLDNLPHVVKPSNPQDAPKRHGKKPKQPGYQGETRSTFDGFPCPVIALLLLAGMVAGAGATGMVLL